MSRSHHVRGGGGDKKEKGTYRNSDLNGILYGTVNKVFKEHGFLKPYKHLPPPYNTEKDVYFDMPEDAAEIKQGQQVVFILRRENIQNPNVADIEFPGVTYDRQFCTPHINEECGHIAFEDKYETKDRSICNKSCMRILSCGHRCLKKCSEKCLKKCTPCFQEWKKGKEALDISSDSDDILFGTVIGIHEDYGFIKPDLPLPHPYNKRKDVYFDMPDDDMNIKKGQKVVFILNKGCYAKPNVCDIAFVGLAYDPKLTLPYRREQCGHICFRNKTSSKGGDDCFKHCTKTLSCGHPCQRKCSDKCLKMCYECFEEKKSKTYLLSDLKDLLYGTVTHVATSYGFLKADCQLPKDYNQSKDIYFPIDKDDGLSISRGQRAVFVLNEESYDRPSVSDIAFVGESYPDSAYPYKHKKCGHICFQGDRDCAKSGMGECVKECLNLLPCGHQCPEICSDICPRMCDDCIEEQEKQAYTVSEMEGLLHGTVVKIKEGYGFLKPNRQLPKPYCNEKDIHFTADLKIIEKLGTTQNVVFLIKKESYDKPYATDVAFPGVSYDTDRDTPYRSEDCGHICFKDTNTGNKKKCMKDCTQNLSCGHRCRKKCSEKCYERCEACYRRYREEKRTYTLDELDDLLFGTVVDPNGHNVFIKPDRQLPPPYNSRKDIAFFNNDSSDLVSKGKRVVFSLAKEQRDKPRATQILVLEWDFDSSTMEPYIRPECGHICLFDRRMQNSLCFNKCSRKLACGHSCLEICSFPCPERCGKCSNIRERAFKLFICANINQICIGFVSFVGEEHGYIKPFLSDQDTANKKTGIYFTFRGSPQCDIKKKMWVAYTMNIGNVEHPTVFELAVVENANADITHFNVYYVKQLPRQKPTRDGQTSRGNQVEKLEIEAQEDYSNRIRSWTLRPNRHPDPTDPLDLNFRMAESHFLRSASKSGKQYQIESIDYYVKPDLVRKFRPKKSYFESCYGKGDYSNYVFAFHGTDSDNIDSIVRENFKLEYCQRSLYGKGIYLSEFVDVSLPYGRSLLLCKVLPGKSLDVTTDAGDTAIAPNFNSHRVKADADGYGWALVIDDPDQILPCYVINYKKVVDSAQSNITVQPSHPPSTVSTQHQAPNSHQNTNRLPLHVTQQSNLAPQVYGSSLATVSSAPISGSGRFRPRSTAVSPTTTSATGSSRSKLTAVSTTTTSGTGSSSSTLTAVSTRATSVTGRPRSKSSANTQTPNLYPNLNAQSLQPQTKQAQHSSKAAPPIPPPPLTVSPWNSNDTTNQGSQHSQRTSNTRQSSSVATYPSNSSQRSNGQATGSYVVPLGKEAKEHDYRESLKKKKVPTATLR